MVVVAAAAHFASNGLHVVGVGNGMRRVFFGDESSTAWMATELERTLLDVVTLVQRRRVVVDDRVEFGPWPNDAHLAAQHVDQLRENIGTGPSRHAPRTHRTLVSWRVWS